MLALDASIVVESNWRGRRDFVFPDQFERRRARRMPLAQSKDQFICHGDNIKHINTCNPKARDLKQRVGNNHETKTFNILFGIDIENTRPEM